MFKLQMRLRTALLFVSSLIYLSAFASAAPGSFTLSANPYCNTTPPAAPAVMLTWSSSSNATSYVVYRNGSAYSGTLSSSQFSYDNNANVTAGQTYTYFIRASNSSGSTDSNTVTVTVPSNVCGSAQPPGNFSLSANPYCNTTPPAAPAIMLTWSSASNATSYVVYRDGSAYSSTLSSSQLSYDNNANVTAGQTYTYFIRASNSNGSTDSNTVTVTVPSNVCGSAQPPGNFSLSANPYCNTTPPAAAAVMLTWSSASNATSYVVYRNGSAYSSTLSSSQLSYDNNANVTAGQTYTYFIRASNSNGSTDSNTVTVTVPSNVCGSAQPPGSFSLSANPYCNTTPPAAPAVMLTWSSASNATSYVVYRNSSAYSGTLSSSQLSYDNNANVTAGQTYTYFIRASNSNGSTDSNTVTVTVPSNVCGSAQPPGNFSLSANPYCNTTPPAAPAVMLTWSSASNATSYVVYRNGSAYSSTLSSSQLSYDNNANVTAGQTYTYFIRASNSNGSTDSNTVTVTVPSNVCNSSQLPGTFSLSGTPYCNTTPPAAPAVTLNWSSSSNATSYVVYRNGSAYSGALGSTQSSFDNNAGVSAGQTYTYFIRASNAAGSTDSNTVAVVVPGNVCGSASPPGGFSLSANPYCNTTPPAAPAVLLNWSSSTDAASYVVYRNGSAYSGVLSPTQSSFDNNAGVSAGQTYVYFVRASNANGSTDSNPVTVVVPSNVCASAPPPGSFTLTGSPHCTTSPVALAIELDWTLALHATSYTLYRNGELYKSDILGTSFDNTVGIEAGQTYSYFVRAFNGAASKESNTVTIGAPSTGCFVPTGGTTSLSGHVVDAFGEPVPSIRLELSGSTAKTTNSDATGSFTFAQLPTGGYTVTPQSDRYTFSPPRLSISLSGGGLPLADFVATAIPNSSTPVAVPYLETNNAFVFSTDHSLGDTQLDSTILGIITAPQVDQIFEDLGLSLGTEGGNVLADAKLAFDLKDFIDSTAKLLDPLRLAPTVKDLTVDSGQAWGPPTLSTASLPMSAVIGLDFLGTLGGASPNFKGPLQLKIDGCGVLPVFIAADTKSLTPIEVMTEGELDGLDTRKSYLIIPRGSFSASAICPLGNCAGDRCWKLTAEIPHGPLGVLTYSADTEVHSQEIPDLLQDHGVSLNPGVPLKVPVNPQSESTSVNLTIDFSTPPFAPHSSKGSDIGTSAPCATTTAAVTERGITLARATVPTAARQTAVLGLLPPDGWHLELTSSCAATAATSLQMLHSEPVLGSSCAGNARSLCLHQSRFKVEVAWRDTSGKTAGVGYPISSTDVSGTFWFFDAQNVELIVKVIDGRALNGHFWLFYGALSDVEYWIRVTDTQTGEVRTYYNPRGNLCGQADTSAFPADSPGQSAARFLQKGGEGAGMGTLEFRAGSAPETTERRTRSCQPGPRILCLAKGRFSVSARWQERSPGASGDGTAIVDTDESGFFWFFDRSNIELVVKVLDGTPVNGNWWIFYGALSDVEYWLTVSDLQTGVTKTYHNHPGNICGAADTSTFPGHL